MNGKKAKLIRAAARAHAEVDAPKLTWYKRFSKWARGKREEQAVYTLSHAGYRRSYQNLKSTYKRLRMRGQHIKLSHDLRAGYGR